jgi:hypothetical protein
VAKGREAIRQRDVATVERIVRELWALAPVDHDEQKLGHGSGLRMR